MHIKRGFRISEMAKSGINTGFTLGGVKALTIRVLEALP